MASAVFFKILVIVFYIFIHFYGDFLEFFIFNNFFIHFNLISKFLFHAFGLGWQIIGNLYIQCSLDFLF